jgi:hypothetical protein
MAATLKLRRRSSTIPNLRILVAGPARKKKMKIIEEEKWERKNRMKAREKNEGIKRKLKKRSKIEHGQR